MAYLPKWHKELDIFRKVKSLLILEGNIFDSFQYPLDGSISAGAIIQLPDYLYYYFSDSGYRNIVFYDHLDGFHNPFDCSCIARFAELTDTQIDNSSVTASFRKSVEGGAAAIISRAVTQTQEATVVIMNFASRYIISPDHMQAAEADSFTILLKASLQCKEVRTENGMRRNLIVMLVNKANDIPAWVFLNHPMEKTILIQPPSTEERELLVKGIAFRTFFDNQIYMHDIMQYDINPADLSRIQERFVALTDGFCFTELNCLRKLCKSEKFSIHNMCDVIDLYKYGIRENPWKKLNMLQLQNADERFRRRVKGQDYAISKTLDVVKRAVTGLAGLQGSTQNRPKGVLFFAGPTGTGKTETAKTLAELLFGDESNCIRFDMSEYSQSHSDQRLLGAPPGYVGYETGGQLTNAVKNNPFSILLFDEIEKAHPSIMDKFLQILEDGRMTDGQGNTVYFSECVIIFTSNLGMYTTDENGVRHQNVNPDMPYAQVRSQIRSTIELYFKEQLGRPEILNRIGENIVVFDFIRPETAGLILNTQIARISERLCTEKNITLNLSENAYKALERTVMGNLSNGGRGIGNIVESLLINPLARFMFDEQVLKNAEISIENIYSDTSPETIECSVRY